MTPVSVHHDRTCLLYTAWRRSWHVAAVAYVGKVGEHLETGLKGHMSEENAGKQIGEAAFKAFAAKFEHHSEWYSFFGSK